MVMSGSLGRSGFNGNIIINNFYQNSTLTIDIRADNIQRVTGITSASTSVKFAITNNYRLIDTNTSLYIRITSDSNSTLISQEFIESSIVPVSVDPSFPAYKRKGTHFER